MVLSIDHIELIVRDVDEFVEFYQKLGFEVLLRTAHHGGSAELKRVNRRYSLGKLLSNMPGFPLNQVGMRAKRVYFRIEVTSTPVLFYPSGVEKGCIYHELTR